MSYEKSDSFLVRFNGKNYSAREFQFKLFVKGKDLWGHIDGKKPAPTSPEDLAKREIKDAQIMTWILSSVEAHFILNLRPYKIAKEMWDYLKRCIIKRTQLGDFNWNMRWLILHKGVSQLRNIFLVFKIFGLNIQTLFMLESLTKPSLLSKKCMKPARETNS